MKQARHRSSRRPLHERVATILRTRVLRGLAPGVKLESESALARRLKVSVHTLRQALSVLAHEGLIARHHGSGTFVAEDRRAQTVAVVTATHPALDGNSFQMRLFLLLTELFPRRGWPCRTYIAPGETPTGWASLAEDVAHGRIAGAAFVAMNAGELGIPFAKHQVPCVGLGWPHQATVELDYVDLVDQGVRQLLRQGCRRIAMMQWMANTPQEQAAHTAFCDALTESGAPIRTEWIRRMVPPVTPGAGWEQFREIWSAHPEKPDGLLVTDDMLFRDVALAILDSRIQVPQQLQVVVHANKGSGVTYPFPVSRLEVDLEEWAETLLRQLIRLMNHEPVSPPVQYIRARLIPSLTRPAGHRSLTGVGRA